MINYNGTGIKDNLISFSKIRSTKDLKKHVNKVITNDIKVVKGVIFNRQGLGPNCIKILEKYGNLKIISLRVYRVPLSPVLMSAINLVSFQQFAERQKNANYDKLFH